MFRRNKLEIGFLLGLLLPLACFVIMYQLFSLLEIKGAASTSGLSANFRERTLAIVAIALNLWPMQVYRRQRMDHAIRGLVFATGLLALVWLFRYGIQLF